MSARRPPLEYRDVVRGLSVLGFEKRPQKATVHEQWIKTAKDRRYKVTVDKSKAPFGQFLVRSMAKQAGLSLGDFYKACGKGQAGS